LGDLVTDTDGLTRPKKRRRGILVAILVSVLVIGGGTVGGLVWTDAEENRQTLARAEDEAAAKKKAASDAFWAKVNADNQKAKAAEEQRAAVEARKAADDAAASRAAAAADLASKGWTKEAAGIYTADIPNATCGYGACSRFLVMTTLAGGCPHGIVIRGRWLKGDTVTGPVTEITGPLNANEQAAVEAKDYTGYADSIDLTEFSCR
jgi:hypothetical protein